MIPSVFYSLSHQFIDQCPFLFQCWWEEVHACSPFLSLQSLSCFLSYLFLFSVLLSDCKSVTLSLCCLPNLSLCVIFECTLCLHSFLTSACPPLPYFSFSLLLPPRLPPKCSTSTWTLAGVSMPTDWWSVKSSAVHAASLVSLCCRPLTMPSLPVT